METQDGPPEKKKMGSGVKIALWIGGILVVILILSALGSNNDNSNAPATAASRSSVPADPIAVACQASSTPQTIGYKELEKDPDSFQGQTATFAGQIQQIQESSGEGAMRFAVDQDAYGNWNFNNVVLMQYDGHTPAVQDDIVTVTGVMEGAQTYHLRSQLPNHRAAYVRVLRQEALVSKPTFAHKLVVYIFEMLLRVPLLVLLWLVLDRLSPSSKSVCRIHEETLKTARTRIQLSLFMQKSLLLIVGLLALTSTVLATPKTLAYDTPTQTVTQKLPETPVALSIPSINLNDAIIPVGLTQNDKMAVPSGSTNNVGWWEGGVIPGNAGSAVLDAHVFAAFAKLNQVAVGDSIYVTDAEGVQRRFVVTKVETYALADITSQMLFAPTNDNDLNLITCAGQLTPDGSTYDHRLVIYTTLAQ